MPDPNEELPKMNGKTTPRPTAPPPASWATSGFGGRGVRHLRRRDRSETARQLAAAGATLLPGLEGEHALVRDAQALRPEMLKRLREEMRELEARWAGLRDEERAPVAEWIESICLPWIEARVPLRASGLQPSWAAEFLVVLIADYDGNGQVVETIDRDGQRPARSSSNPATTARLAVAAGWLAWSSLIVDPTLSTAVLNVLAELLDRLDAMLLKAVPDPADASWHLSAIALESRLMHHRNPRGGAVH